MQGSTFADQAESFCIALQREEYEVGAGLKSDLDLVSIYQQYSDLFSPAAVKERIGALQTVLAEQSRAEKVGPPEFKVVRENTLKENRHLADFVVGGYIENVTKEMTEGITNAELRATVEWEDRVIPYQEVRSVLVRIRDSERRHDLQARQLAVTARQNPARAARLDAQHRLAGELGFAGYRRMIEQLRGWDLPILAQALKPLIDETDGIFEERLGTYLTEARVPRRRADTSDVAFVMRAPEYDSFFPADRLVPSLEKTVAGMGLGLDTTPGLHLDTAARPLKSPRAFCAPIRIPSDVYLVIKPVGGQDDFRALFHEGGHAEHYTHIDASVPFAFRYLGEEAISETFAFLFEQITLSPRWLVDTLRLPMREAEHYRRFALFNKLWLVRRYIAKLRYELVLHDEGPGGMETAYRDLLGDVLHLPVPPERYLEDVDDAFYVAGYLRAWIFERQLGSFLLNQFGEGWYEAVEAGKFLRKLWEGGLRDPVDQMARERLGAKGLDPMPLIQELADF
jgi:hypothetical protein